MRRPKEIGFLRDFALYGVNSAITKLLAILALPIITRFMSVEGYGIIESIVGFTSLLPIFIGLGYDIAVKKSMYIDTERIIELPNSLFRTVLIFLLVWGSVILVPLLALSKHVGIILLKTDQYTIAVAIAIVGVYANLIINLILTLKRAQLKVSDYTKISLLQNILQYAFIIFTLLVLHQGITGYQLASFAANIILALFVIYINRSAFSGRYDKKKLKEILKFGFPTMVASFAYWIFSSSDRLMLMQICGPVQTGLYSMALRITSVVTFVISSFQHAWTVRAFEMYHDDPEGFPQKLCKFNRYSQVFFSILSLGLVAVSELMLHILSTNEFYPSYLSIIPLGMANIFYPLTFVGCIGIYISNHTKDIAIFSWVSAGINVTINIFMLPYIGAAAASLSTMFSYMFLYIAYFNRTIKYMNWKITFRLPIIMFILAGIGFISMAIDMHNIIINLIIRCLIVIVFILLQCIFKIINIKEVISIIRRRSII